MEEGSDPPPRRLNGALGGLAEERFELGEDLLNRVEIRRIRRQEAQRSAHSLNGPPHSRALVAAEIVQDDEVASREGREQAVFHIGQEAGTVDRAIEDTGSSKAVVTEGRYEGQSLPMAMWPLGDQPLATRTAAVAAGHIGLRPCLINEHEPVGITLALRALPACAPPRYIRPLLLGGREAFF